MKFATKAIHAGQEPDPTTGAVMTPIYQTSTYWQKSPGDNKGYEYSRGTNPTRQALEDCLAALENAKYGLAFSSGMGATDAVMKLLQPGDEVITCTAAHTASSPRSLLTTASNTIFLTCRIRISSTITLTTKPS